MEFASSFVETTEDRSLMVFNFLFYHEATEVNEEGIYVFLSEWFINEIEESRSNDSQTNHR